MKHIAFIALWGLAIPVALFVLLSCGPRKEYRDALARAEAMMSQHPDSALRVLDSLGKHEADFNRHFRMQYLLLRTDALNKADSVFTSDTDGKLLADYFDRHGTVNERMLAHYLLGRAYSDMGDAPRAISCYQDAVEAADTTLSDFNFYTLDCIYSQMATVFRSQLLLTNEIEAHKKASHYAFRAGKTEWGIYNLAMTAGAYILLNKKDSAEIVLKSAIEQYRKNGYTQQALRYSRALLHLYTENPQRMAEAKTLMDQFEAQSDLFDQHHELPPSQRQYYYYKGKYYEENNMLDSAEFYYRKIYFQGMDYVHQDPMYRGLLSVFSKRHQADSIAKYAFLYCMVNDSSIALNDREVVARMTASYNYSKSQKELEKQRKRADRAKASATYIILLAVLLITMTIWLYYKKQRIKTARVAKLENDLLTAITTRSNIQEELEKLKGQDYESVIAEKERKLNELTKTIAHLTSENQTYKGKEETRTHNNHLDHFLNSPIALLFVKKASGKTERTVPTESEWKLLTSQFSKDLPVTYKSFAKGKALSQLEQRICILLILDIPEFAISILSDTSASTISNAKARANEKLFGKKEAHPLKTNLLHALQQS